MIRRASLWIPILVAVLLMGGCGLLAKEPSAIGSLTMTDKVTEGSMAPTNSLTTFPTSAKLIYAAALVQRPQKGTKVAARWTFDKDGQGHFIPVDASTVSFPEARKESYVAFSLKAVSNFLPGTYKVEILLDDKPAKDLTFTIRD